MMISPVGFMSHLTATYASTDQDLPVPAADMARLVYLLGPADYVFLTISDEVYVEVIKVSGACGAVLVERAQDGTDAHNFPKGSCVSFRVQPAVVRDMVCNTICCEVRCCTPVAVVAGTMPNGTVGQPYSATVIFTGSAPISIGYSGGAAWMTITTGPNFLTVSGTPPVPQTLAFSVGATNCNGAVVTTASVLKFEGVI